LNKTIFKWTIIVHLKMEQVIKPYRVKDTQFMIVSTRLSYSILYNSNRIRNEYLKRRRNVSNSNTT